MANEEKDIWRAMGRIDFGKNKHNSHQREPYNILFDKYHSIYYSYLMNILMTEFKYHNVPETINTDGLEYSLRYYGYGSLTALDKDTIYIGSPRVISPGINSVFGSLIDSSYDKSLEDLLGNKKVTQLNRMNYKDAELPVSVIIPNKKNFYLYTSTLSDMTLVDSTADVLAEIKAETILNIRQQKTPFIGITTDNSLTAYSVWQQLEDGHPFIAVDKNAVTGKKGLDKDVDLNKIMQILPTQAPNLAATLKDSWNDAMNEFLTMVGLDSVAVDKKERLVASEAESNDQQVSNSANIYLDARNDQLKLLNERLGTDIYVTMNFDDLKERLKLLSSDFLDDVDDEEDGDDNNEQEVDDKTEQDK